MLLLVTKILQQVLFTVAACAGETGVRLVTPHWCMQAF